MYDLCPNCLVVMLCCRDVFEVNFMGAVATSQAFIPLLRAGQQRGRIVNISSVVSESLHTEH
jgi:NAD(P)-dependent dehydrogenase (short-subunit alcohol dehydrogenase family)